MSNCTYWTYFDEYVYERDKLDSESTPTDRRQVDHLYRLYLARKSADSLRPTKNMSDDKSDVNQDQNKQI
jgi:hypothetical protein